MSMTLILGGARSGKSRYAQELAAKSGNKVLFLATGEALDEEMRSRIEIHKKSRPSSWKTLEAPTNIAKALRNSNSDAEIIIIDCMTLLVSNLMGRDDIDAETLEKRVNAELQELIAFMEQKATHFIIVSNELGLGIVPVYPAGRVYRDALGMANQVLARHANKVYFMIAGIPMPLKDADPK